jgi:gamma-glutamyltranspeptidase/glutathione hydrolase
MTRATAKLAALSVAALLAACADGPAPAVRPEANAEIAATAHPLATRAALAMLGRGGSAADAAIAAQMVLGLVEPQSSGIGGGTLVLYWDGARRSLASFDGLAGAPARVTPGLRRDVDGTLLDATQVQRGGRSVGVPGTLPVLKLLHERQGKLPWADLFAPAIAHAETGFPLPPYLHSVLAGPNAAQAHPELVPLYFGADGRVLPVGTTIRNPDYARTLRRIAAGGPAAQYEGEHGAAFLAAAARGYRPSMMTAQDLAAYRAVERPPLCAPFLVVTVCTMGPPSYGGLTVLQVLRMVEMGADGAFDLGDPGFAHLYLEAAKLAQADRRLYVGDPGFVDVPARELTAPGYLRDRAAGIDRTRANREPRAGQVGTRSGALAPDDGETMAATSQIAIADRGGNVVSITTTINLNFGARLAVGGYVLNNAMSNFAPAPAAGARSANRMEPGKRPVTSMAPTIVFDRDGRPILAGGSAGGGPIVDYIAASLIDMLARDRTPAEAAARPRLSAATPGKIQIEQNRPDAAALIPALRALGHEVETATLPSGTAFIKRRGDGWIGASDPRRDGSAEGLGAR